jgi:thiol-disulfide isomerase/thioredoxin
MPPVASPGDGAAPAVFSFGPRGYTVKAQSDIRLSFIGNDMTMTIAPVAEAVAHFTLYSRSYCHLCDDLLEALQSLSGEFPFTVEVIDIDSDESLVAQFDELVPVLFGRMGEGGGAVQLCHYFLDEAKVRTFMARPPGL